MTYEMILSDIRDAVCTITLNRPEKLNAMADGMVPELLHAMDAADHDDAVNVILLTGAGRGFCAGLDLTQNREAREPSRWEQLDDLGQVSRQALAVLACSKPVIAAINGAAAGAGLAMALNCDTRVMSAGARVTTGYARRGLSPDGAMSYTLPRLVGMTRAADLIFTARDIIAEEALSIGLVAHVYPAESFREDAHAYAASIARNAPIGLVQSKRLLAQSLTNPLLTQLKQEMQLIRAAFQTEDVKEAVRAFAEKRQPTFRGR